VNFYLTFNPEIPFLILCNTSLRKDFKEKITSFLKTSAEMEYIKFRNIDMEYIKFRNIDIENDIQSQCSFFTSQRYN